MKRLGDRLAYSAPDPRQLEKTSLQYTKKPYDKFRIIGYRTLLQVIQADTQQLIGTDLAIMTKILEAIYHGLIDQNPHVRQLAYQMLSTRLTRTPQPAIPDGSEIA